MGSRNGNQIAKDPSKTPDEHNDMEYKQITINFHEYNYLGALLIKIRAIIAYKILGIRTAIKGGSPPCKENITEN